MSKRLPRSPSAAARHFTCSACGCREAAAGGGPGFMCQACKAAGNYRHTSIAANTLLGKTEATKAVFKAIKAGILPLPASSQCVDCPSPATLYEHRDYNKPLDVVPVCKSCNAQRGAAIPLRGGINKMVGFGFAPYANKAHAAQIFAALGLNASLLDGLPKRLTHAAWVALLPAIDAVEALKP